MTLKAVPSELPQPPYPKTTAAKGWLFDLDHERLWESDTWALSPPDMRPWLLMVWMISWRQVPVGSLPNNEEVIAARIGMDLRIFRAHRDILLRGFQLHSDGRLYHPVLVEHANKMIEQRAIWAGKKRIKRASEKNQSLSENVQGDSLGSPCGVSTPTPTPTEKTSPLAQSEVGKEVVTGSSTFAAPEQFCAGGEPW